MRAEKFMMILVRLENTLLLLIRRRKQFTVVVEVSHGALKSW